MGTTVLVVAAMLGTGAVLADFADRHRWTRRLLTAAVGSLWFAVALVVAALIREDTTLRIVVDHTRPGLGLAYRVMGLWGGSAGSLLTFTAIVGAVLTIAPTPAGRRWLSATVVATLTWTSILLASPFERLPNPAIAGSGLTPILEHWAMVIHPPLLYLGLALALVPALEGKGRNPSWGHAALIVLTTALALGAGWAYVELGWGGWWAWDPVENAALIPWLLLVVGLHAPDRYGIAAWSHALVWPAVFAGTAMTRTSLRTSVHAFANADALEWTLWPLAAVGSGAVLWWTRRDAIESAALRGVRLVPAVVAFTTAVIVAAGTFRPLVPGDATAGSYYSRFLFPVALVAVVGAGLLPRWSDPRGRVVRDGVVGVLLGLGLTITVGWTTWYQVVLAVALGAGAATLVGGGVRPLARFAAHLGLLLVLAATLGGTASLTRTIPLTLGEQVSIGSHTLQNNGVELTADSPPVITATVLLDQRHELSPQLVVYPERNLRLPEVATHSRPWEDVQVILRSADDDGSILVTINIEPLTQLVWIGAVLLALGVFEDQRSRRSRRARRSSSTVDRGPTEISSERAAVESGSSADS